MAVNRQVIAGRTGELMLPCAASGYRWGRISCQSGFSGIFKHVESDLHNFLFFAYKEYLL